MDSLSLPSEPPDVRNWFASYVYESPELDTLDGFQDSHGSGESVVEKEKQVSLSKAPTADKLCDDLIAGANHSMDATVKSNESDVLEQSKSIAAVAGLSESFSHLSEPHDIRKWFASYVYESPELDTLDGFQDSHGSGESVLEKEKQESLSKAPTADKLCDDLIAGANQSMDATVKCNEPDALEESKSTAAVAGLSESFSLLSEPPDIKNWFSSYLYASPELDALDNFAISDYKEGKNEKTCDQRKFLGKDVMNVADVSQNTELPCNSRSAAAIVNCTNFVKNAKQDNQYVLKQNDLQINLSNSTPQKISESILPNHRTIEKLSKSDKDGKEGEMNSGCSWTHRSCNVEKNRRVDKYLHKFLTEREESLEHNLEKEDMLNSSAGPTVGINGKENKVNHLLEDGFVSTRNKIRQSHTGAALKVKAASNFDKKDAKIIRKTLSETTNFHSPNNDIVEITGKWRCTHTDKPNFGPPLKQLRLEQWLRRA